jgi:hypothetical protein
MTPCMWGISRTLNGQTCLRVAWGERQAGRAGTVGFVALGSWGKWLLRWLELRSLNNPSQAAMSRARIPYHCAADSPIIAFLDRL